MNSIELCCIGIYSACLVQVMECKMNGSIQGRNGNKKCFPLLDVWFDYGKEECKMKRVM